MTKLNKLMLIGFLLCFCSCGVEKKDEISTTTIEPETIVETEMPIKPTEICSPEELGVTEYANIAKVYFFTGTCHYRNKNYQAAANNWQKLAALDEVDPEYQELQTSVLNNLGYLMFFGLGIEKNKNQALEYWHKGVDLGDMEPEYHLCHAYADEEESTYNPEKGLIHCDKAKALYDKIEEPSETQKTIVNNINDYVLELTE